MRDDLMMGRNEYARHRDCSPNAVKKAEESGRIAGAVKRDENGAFVGIDWRRADQLWARNTDPGEAAKNGKTNVAPANDSMLPLGEPSDQRSEDAPLAASKSGEDPHGYLAARADRERSAARLAELNLLERQGELVSAADVRDTQFSLYRQHRDKLEQIPVSISERLAAETDPQRVEHMLRTAIRETLNELSRALAVDAAAGGVQERAAASV